MQPAAGEVDLIPFQVHELGDPQAVPVGHQEERPVPEPVATQLPAAAALAAIDDLPPDEFVFAASIVLGDADRALRAVERVSRGTDVMDNVIWWDVAEPVRQTAGFRRLVSAVGLEQLWRAQGWPDKCRPKEGGDFVCD